MGPELRCTPWLCSLPVKAVSCTLALTLSQGTSVSKALQKAISGTNMMSGPISYILQRKKSLLKPALVGQ